MGMGSIGIWQLAIVLLRVIMLFGSKRIGSLGSDLGAAVRGFRKNVSDDTKAEKVPEA